MYNWMGDICNAAFETVSGRQCEVYVHSCGLPCTQAHFSSSHVRPIHHHKRKYDSQTGMRSINGEDCRLGIAMFKEFFEYIQETSDVYLGIVGMEHDGVRSLENVEISTEQRKITNYLLTHEIKTFITV